RPTFPLRPPTAKTSPAAKTISACCSATPAGWSRRRRPIARHSPCARSWPPTSQPSPRTVRTWHIATATWRYCSAKQDGPGRPGGGEAAHRAALALRTELATDFPAVPEYRQEVAGSHNNLGVLLREQGRPVEATAAHRTALALEQKMVEDFPDVPGYRQDVA